MTRKHAIRDAEPHVVVSHGADFFGEDRHPIRELTGLAEYVQNSVSYVDRKTVAPLVQLLETPTAATFEAAEADQLSVRLLKVARTPRIKPAVAARARALADAAARAAASGECWTWTVEAASTSAA